MCKIKHFIAWGSVKRKKKAYREGAMTFCRMTIDRMIKARPLNSMCNYDKYQNISINIPNIVIMNDIMVIMLFDDV